MFPRIPIPRFVTPLWVILLPLLGVLAPILGARRSRLAAACSAFLPPAASFGLLLSLIPTVFQKGEPVVATWEWVSGFGPGGAGLHLSFRVDGLGFFFAFLILAIGLLIVAYAHWYLEEEDPPGRFFASLLLFMGAMLGVVLSENLLVMVVFWELTSISSFLLIGYWYERQVAREGARMALTITGAGGLALLGGVLLLGEAAGSYQLSVVFERVDRIQDSPYFLPSLFLILGGAFTKSAQFPFQSWLPNAMTAPTPVSAYLHSATMVKAGIFLMARLHPVFAGTDAWLYTVSGIGLVTMVFGAWVAIRETDLKGLLAYSTISHLGLITACLGFSSRAAVFAAIFHIFNHAAFKASLFMTAGIVDHEAGTRDIRELGGLWRAMPVMTVLAGIGTAGMAGVPFFNGFLSKEKFFMQAVEIVSAGGGGHGHGHGQAAGALVDMPASWIVPVAATLGGIVSVAYSIRFFVDTFFGDPPGEYPGHPHDPPAGFWIPVAILAVITVVVGIVPNVFADPFVALAAAATATGQFGLEVAKETHIKLWHGFNLPLLMSGLAFGVGGIVYALRDEIYGFYDGLGEIAGKDVFQGLVAGYMGLSRFVTDNLDNGSLQRYASFVLATAIAAGGYAFWRFPFAWGERSTSDGALLDIVGAGLLIAGAFLTAWIQKYRMRALISAGVVGLMLSLAFVRFSAPDLAMTQLSVEVVNVLLLLLALFALPETGPSLRQPLRRTRDIGLAVVGGGGVAFLSYAVMTRGYDRMADYFLANSYHAAHGKNVVNVILVDFRAFDTMGEISVLAIAALGIYSMLTGSKPKMPQPRPASREQFPMILSHVARPLMALVLTAAVYIFLRGHNQPGGGFIAGLVATVALIIQYVAHGQHWADQRMRTNFRRLASVGVVIAVVSGMAAWLFGAPFLKQGLVKLEHVSVIGSIPILSEVKLVSTIVFDLGVFCAVVGAVMTALVRIGEFNRHDSPHPIDPTVPPGEGDDPWNP